MFRPDKGVKLMDRPVRDPITGEPTGVTRARPTYDIMAAVSELTVEEIEALVPYRHHPTYIDNCYAGQETWYYRFTVEAECKAKLNRFLSE